MGLTTLWFLNTARKFVLDHLTLLFGVVVIAVGSTSLVGMLIIALSSPYVDDAALKQLINDLEMALDGESLSEKLDDGSFSVPDIDQK